MTITEIYQKIFPNETEPWKYNNFNVYFKRLFTPLKQKLKYSIENEFNITLKDLEVFVEGNQPYPLHIFIYAVDEYNNPVDQGTEEGIVGFIIESLYGEDARNAIYRGIIIPMQDPRKGMESLIVRDKRITKKCDDYIKNIMEKLRQLNLEQDNEDVFIDDFFQIRTWYT